MPISAVAVPPSPDLTQAADGVWSGFILQLGSGPVSQPGSTTVTVDISTTQTLIYAVDWTACNNSTCTSLRGNTFNSSSSSTWIDKGYYSLSLAPTVGYPTIAGHFGFDNISTGYAGYGGPTLGKQTIATFQSFNYSRGVFGLQPRVANLGTIDNPYPSFLENLKESFQIPSLSWGYTAGNPYTLGGVSGSLTFGGYDDSRRISNDLSFKMGTDTTRYLTVGLRQINIRGATTGNGNIMTDSISVNLDSTLPYLWLPQELCERFEEAFNLQYDSSSNTYFIPRTVNDGLSGENGAFVDFTLGDSNSAISQTFQITMPYAAFNLTGVAPFPGTSNGTSVLYFPLKRATNSGQYTLGRAFFQEAYIVADFERQNFSVSRATYRGGSRTSLTAISPVTTPTPVSKSGGSNAGAIAGGVVGGIVAIVIIAGLLFWFRRRRRTKEKNEESEHDEQPPEYSANPDMTERSEMEGSHFKPRGELEATESGRGTPNGGYYGRGRRSRSPAADDPVFEMPAQSSASELPGNPALSRNQHVKKVDNHRPSLAGVLSGAAAGETSDDGKRSEGRPSVHSRQMSEETTVSMASEESFQAISPASIALVSNGKAGARSTVVSDTSEPERVVSPEPSEQNKS